MKVRLAIQKIDKTLGTIIQEDLSILKEIKSYVIESGGKRIRPILHLVFADMLDYKEKDKWIVASITELIHAASLLHDDVVDEADMRRGKKTVGSKFGNKTAILAGDFLLACGIERLNSLHSPTLMDIFTEVIRDLSVSELMQMQWEKNPKITIDTYNKIIYGKTSSLFGAATESASILSGKSRKESLSIRKFGISMGNIFQKRDDLLDYFQLNEDSGKDFLKDFHNKLYTYPILVLRSVMEKSEQKILPQIIESSDKKKILELLETYQILNRIKKELQNEIASLMKFLDKFQKSSSQKLLKEQLSKLEF